MLYLIPIEPYEERYSEQWYRWYMKECQALNIKFEMIDGDQQTTTLENNQVVLSPVGTNIYKMSQLTKILYKIKNGNIKDGDKFYFFDGWFPGVSSIKYCVNMLGLDIEMYAFFHAGTYDKYDFTYQHNMESWGKHLENAWFDIYNKIFVASEYHKNLLVETRNIDASKIYVVGIPIYKEEYMADIIPGTIPNSENTIVFPHRLADEKQFEDFRFLEDYFIRKDKHWNFVVAKDVCNTKKDYYNLLYKAKVSFSSALQETFGIAMYESIALKCCPVVPNRLSYVEYYPILYRYDSLFEAATRIERHITYNNTYSDFNHEPTFEFNLKKFEFSIRNILYKIGVCNA